MARKITLSFISAVLLLACAPDASAQFWSTPGFVGIVDEADTSIHVFGSNGAVAIRSSVARGTLNLRYPVQGGVPGEFFPPDSGDCTQIRAMLRDTGPGARVIVRLMRLSIGGDLVLGELSSVAEIDSDTSLPGPSNQYTRRQACLTEHPGTLGDYAYFMDVQLIKTAATASPGLMSLQICNNEDACEP
jgi:hypothetical protein